MQIRPDQLTYATDKLFQSAFANWRTTMLTCLYLFGLVLGTNIQGLQAQQGHWIWTAEQDAKQAPVGSCFFRKKFELSRAREVTMIAAADDQFTVYVNGKLVGSGSQTTSLTRIDLTSFVHDGENIIAVQVVNSSGNTAAFACQIKIQEGATKTPR